jgi:hypothetical protein
MVAFNSFEGSGVNVACAFGEVDVALTVKLHARSANNSGTNNNNLFIFSPVLYNET